MFEHLRRPAVTHHEPPKMTEAEEAGLLAVLKECARKQPQFTALPRATCQRVPSVPERLLYLVAVPAAVSAATSALLIWWFGA